MTFLALFGQSVPNFWLGIMLILIFAVRFGWLPSQGYGLSPRYFLLPMITLAVAGLARLTRLVRSGMLDVLARITSAPPAPRASGIRSSSSGMASRMPQSRS